MCFCRRTLRYQPGSLEGTERGEKRQSSNSVHQLRRDKIPGRTALQGRYLTVYTIYQLSRRGAHHQCYAASATSSLFPERKIKHNIILVIKPGQLKEYMRGSNQTCEKESIEKCKLFLVQLFLKLSVRRKHQQNDCTL